MSMGIRGLARPWFANKASAAPTGVEGYDLALKRRAEAGRRDLVVMFSSGRRFSLYKHDFGRDVLFVADPDLRYYLRGARHLAAAVTDVIDRGGYDRVIFAGSSKGGFGALAIARLCARARPKRAFHVLAFSPQVRLFPRNPALYFNSYEVLLRRAERQPHLQGLLERFGDVSDVGDEPNLVIELVYARDAAVDRVEALRIGGPQVRHRVVAGATHGTAFHFMCHGLDRDEIRDRIKKAYRRTGDQDLQQTKPKDVRALVDEIMHSALREPSLNQLLDEVLSRELEGRNAKAPGLARRIADALSGIAEKTRAFRFEKS